jgi:hypothetical protein
MRFRRLPIALHALVILAMCGSLVAQTQEPLPPQESQGDSRYAGETPSSSGFALDLQSSLTHDNNIFRSNADRQGDSAFQEGAFLNLWKTRPLWSVELEYRPTILLHETATAFNALDQGLKLDGIYHLRRNLQFQWKEAALESVYYTAGGLESASNEHFSLPTGPPPILNSTLITPSIRELTNQSELDVIYDISRRSFFEVSGNYAFVEFPGGTSSTLGLFNTQSSTGGLGYQYRLTRHLTLGSRYLFQNFHYDLAGRDDTHSMFLTALWQMGPHVVVSVFGGPSFSRTGGPLTILSGNAGASENILPTVGKWSPGAGASLTLRSDQTVLRLTVQRLVADGGGLLTTVVNAYEGAELRRRLAYGWDLVLMASNARSIALQGVLGRGALDTQSGEVALEHSLFENLSVHFEYDFVRQRANQYVPFAADVDDQRYTVGILYRIGTHKLTGRFASPPSD